MKTPVSVRSHGVHTHFRLNGPVLVRGALGCLQLRRCPGPREIWQPSQLALPPRAVRAWKIRSLIFHIHETTALWEVKRQTSNSAANETLAVVWLHCWTTLAQLRNHLGEWGESLNVVVVKKFDQDVECVRVCKRTSVCRVRACVRGILRRRQFRVA